MPEVVQLAAAAKARKEKHQRKYLVISTLAFPNAEIREGEVVAFCFGEGQPVMFSRWLGRTPGRDMNGRFVPKGSDREAMRLSCGLKYSAECLRKGPLRILGPVSLGNVVAKRLTAG